MNLKPLHLIIGGVVITGALFLGKTVRAAKNLVVVPQLGGWPRFEGLTRLVVPLDAAIQNPTNGTLRFTFPHVQLIFDGVVIATSRTRPEILDLGPNGEIRLSEWIRHQNQSGYQIPPFALAVNLTTAFIVAPALFALAQGRIDKLMMQARITTTAFPPGLPTLDGKLIKVDFEFPISLQGLAA